MNKKFLYIGVSTIAIAILGRILYKNIYLAGQWDFNIGSFKIDKYKPLTITQTIEFINKSNLKITIRNLNIEVLTEGVKIGAIEQPAEQSILGKGVSPFKITYVLDVSLKGAKVANAFQKLGAAILAKEDLPLDFIGSVEVKGLLGFSKVPIRYSSTGKTLYQMYMQS